MLNVPRHSRRAIAAIAAAALLVCANGAHAQNVSVRFALDRAIDGAAAPFVWANAKNLYRNENLNVTTEIAAASQDAT